eukprot:332060_1
MVTNHLTWIFKLFIYLNVSLHSYFIRLNANYNGYLVIGRDITFKDDTANINTNKNNNVPPQSFKVLVETTDNTSRVYNQSTFNLFKSSAYQTQSPEIQFVNERLTIDKNYLINTIFATAIQNSGFLCLDGLYSKQYIQNKSGSIDVCLNKLYFDQYAPSTSNASALSITFRFHYLLNNKNYINCATLPNPWASLSNGQNTVLSYSFQPTTTSATLTYFHVSFPSPTHTTSTPAQVTPILPGAPTSSPIKSPTTKTPPNNPIKTPTQSPVLPPGTPTKAPVTLHPIQIGTAKPRALTDDQVTARQTQPTQSATKQPTSQGATNWDCVSWGIFIIKWTKYSIIVFISTNNYKSSINMFCVSLPSPTHATSTPTQVTPIPTTHPSQSPILPGTPTGSPIKTPTGSPIKTPTNNPIKTPTQSPVLPPGTPTKAPVTPHPTQMGTAKPTTHAPTDDQGTARPTQPTTKQPTSQGATNWDCVSWGIFIIKWTKYSIIVFISTNNYKSSINMFCVSLPSPTHATSTPTQETPVPTDNPTQSPILQVHLLVRSPIKTPTNNPIKTPTQMALLNQPLLAHTDDLVKGATDWDCVSISGLDGDNLNGNYNKLSDK